MSTRVGMPSSTIRRRDVVAVHQGEVPVQHHDVVVVDLDALQGRSTVVHDIDGHGLTAQSGGHRIGEQLLVLHDEYAHGAVLP